MTKQTVKEVKVAEVAVAKVGEKVAEVAKEIAKVKTELKQIEKQEKAE